MVPGRLWNIVENGKFIDYLEGKVWGYKALFTNHFTENATAAQRLCNVLKKL